MSAISGFSSNPVSSTDDAFNTLSSSEFLQIIFTELQNQDPLEPQDSGAMLDQLSALRAIESDTKMVSSLENLVGQNEFAAASQLIGSLVSGIDLNNQRTADMVISVSQSSEGPVLNLFDGSRMLFSQVDEVAGPINNIDPDGGDDPVDDPGNTDGPSGDGITLPNPVIGDADMLDPDIDQRDTPSGDAVGQTVAPG
jgi:flagellar basal-body rod modification protein FlgD